MATLQARLEALAAAIGVDIKILRGVTAVASTATLTPDSLTHQYNITAQAAALAIANPTGSPGMGQSMIIRIKDNGTIRAISWSGTQWRAIGVTLPTTTVANKTLYIGAKWNATDTKWDVLAVAQEA